MLIWSLEKDKLSGIEFYDKFVFKNFFIPYSWLNKTNANLKRFLLNVSPFMNIEGKINNDVAGRDRGGTRIV